MNTTRTQWRTLHRRARQEKLQPGTRELAAAVCDVTGGTFGSGWNLSEIRLQRAADIALRPAEPMRRRLARDVLNGWGTRNAMRSPDPGPGSYYQPNARFAAWQAITSRADALRRRLEDAGRLVLDGGYWATGDVLPLSSNSPRADRVKVLA